ncbi:MAG: beta-glucosidase [Balneolaceae bacterium]|nr:beta-glucosidase [Balneolaceae bacterium]MBO6547028.1 beta-glucosidase [Balneolaceae bacterium]MBO6648025.1 beta-glucosidase [Balneolaceae bacterium]
MNLPEKEYNISKINMGTFGKDFVWGTATSAYQIEGGYNENGKGPSIWDAFCTIPGKIKNGDTGNIACDHFNRFKDDIKLLKDLGVNSYRLSLSWSRIMPEGKNKVNEDGINFYNDIIDELLKNDITPWVTLYHWDLPLALQLEDDGWLGESIINNFVTYADVCFKRFGDRVKNWITLNEPWVVAILGHGHGVFAPGRVSEVEPYRAAHNLLLAHAHTVDHYRNNYSSQNGNIGITNNCDWREPLTESQSDIEASQRALEFFLGWFADPVYFGDYPQVMKDRIGNKLPDFTPEQKKLLKGSSDFFGLNHYTTMYAANKNGTEDKTDVHGNGGISEDQDVSLSVDDRWKLTKMNWAVVPWGCKKLLHWISDRYDNPDIYITENGCAFDDKVVEGQIDDSDRVEYFSTYLAACEEAIKEGVNLKGYFAWSFLDNFEWNSGYSKRFGIYYVDFETLERIPKSSAKWFKKFLSGQIS